MTQFELIAILFTLAAVLGFVNAHFIGLPHNIGILALSLIFSLALLGLSAIGAAGWVGWAQTAVAEVEFSQTLLNGMLSVILFAGAVQVDLKNLGRQGWLVGLLATLGVVVTALLVGAGLYGVQALLGLQLPFLYCLLFGVLIAPTDPVAVLGVFQRAGVPESFATKMKGEALFNDGMSIVLFLALSGMVGYGQSAAGQTGGGQIGMLFVREVFGGIGLGLATGAVAFGMLRSLNGYTVEVLVTLALVSGGYALALSLHCSGPLTVVVAGLLLGNHGRRFAVSPATEEHLDTFWDLLDELVNILLFLLIGLTMLSISFGTAELLAGAIAIPLVLLARLIVVSGIVKPLALWRPYERGTIPMLTWAGLRGGVSVALALALPASPQTQQIVAITYVVVVFSILVQGLTITPVARRLMRL